MMSVVGMFATADRRSECPLVGTDWKWAAHGQNGGNDPKRKSTCSDAAPGDLATSGADDAELLQ
jgi:hypothetical protein